MTTSELSLYRQLAPFTADKLVDAANALLTAKRVHGITKRTLRFYTAQRVVPGPMGSPKFARYGYEHLLTLLAARALQDQGMKLEQIVVEVSEIKRGRLDRLEQLVDGWLSQSDDFPLAVAENRAGYAKGPARVGQALEAEVGSRVRRISVTRSCTLELGEGAVVETDVKAAIEYLNEFLEKVQRAKDA